MKVCLKCHILYGLTGKYCSECGEPLSDISDKDFLKACGIETT